MARKNNFQKDAAFWCQAKLISFNPNLAVALKSINAGLFLNQLLFWWGKGKYESWIWKTSKEITNETGLSRREQDHAIKICKQFGLIDVQLWGNPRRRYFKIDMEKVRELGEGMHRRVQTYAP